MDEAKYLMLTTESSSHAKDDKKSPKGKIWLNVITFQIVRHLCIFQLVNSDILLNGDWNRK